MSIKVEHPFQIPPKIDNVTAGPDTAVALGELQTFLRRLVVFDGYRQAYWALIVASLAVVLVCEVVGAIIVVFKVVRGRMQLFDAYTVKSRRIPIPNLLFARVVTLAMSGLIWVGFCIHCILLDHEMRKSALDHMMLWLSLIWIPVLYSTYLYLIDFSRNLSSSTERDYEDDSKRARVRRVAMAIIKPAVPAVLSLAAAVPAERAQQLVDHFGQRLIVVHNTMTNMLNAWLAEHVVSTDGMQMFRDYEDDTIELWKDTYDAYAMLQRSYIVWCFIFGGLLIAHAVLLFKQFRARKSQTHSQQQQQRQQQQRSRWHSSVAAAQAIPMTRKRAADEETLVGDDVSNKEGRNGHGTTTHDSAAPNAGTADHTSGADGSRASMISNTEAESVCGCTSRNQKTHFLHFISGGSVLFLILSAYVTTAYVAAQLNGHAMYASVKDVFAAVFAYYAVLVPILGIISIFELCGASQIEHHILFWLRS